LVYSPYERRYNDGSVQYQEWQDFVNYRDYFHRNGTKLYTPYRQDNFDKPWWETDGIQFFILGPAAHIAMSPTRELHDACLVVHAKLATRRCLFTGDASDANLKYVAENTNNICNDILRASHHGSINGADLDFIKACGAKYTVVSTQPGVHDNIPHPTAMARYRDNTKEKVYRTDIDGSLKWTF
jgi:beta-lactamase superfamily II metal-dependent hydrolase